MQCAGLTPSFLQSNNPSKSRQRTGTLAKHDYLSRYPNSPIEALRETD
jgi:hypothetical protein